MATFITSPRECSSCCCVCPAPNGFGPDGNRVCLTFGPEPCYEVCDFCDNMVLETEMGAHECPEAVAVLQEVAQGLLAHEAGEDSEEEEATPVATK